ncbi:MAG: pilus assembly protein PilM [Chloroflexota bacterium]|nr:pilus assembly protein PilM [Chloroflexota bacterium]
MFSKRVTTLNIEADSIRILAIKGKQITNWGSLPLEPGIVRDGLVLHPEALSQSIDALFQQMKIPKKNIAISLTGLRSAFRILSLPKTKLASKEESIRRAAKKEMPVPLEELYISWQHLTEGNGEQHIFVMGVPRDIVDAEIKTLQKSTIKPAIIDVKPLALARMVNRQNALIIDMESDSYGVTLIANGTPDIIRTITPKGGESTQEDNLQHLTEEISRVVEFHNRNHVENPLSPDTPVFLTGELSEDVITIGLLQSRMVFQIEPLPQPFDCPKELPIATYAVNIGLALRQWTPKTNKKPSAIISGSLNLNLLPDAYRRKPLPLKYAFITLATAIVIGGLFPVYQAIGDVDIKTESLRSELDETTIKLQKINQVVESWTRIEDTIASIEAEADALEDETQAIMTMGSHFHDTTQLIVDALPATVRLTSIGMAPNQIILNGQADSLLSVIDYTKALENQGVFSSVFITNLGSAFSITINN